uniref:CUB domain-containing protein n=2 Tax=Biomphalaria glabrata TaxID=6526 RepID=A0A2C9KQC9_BIOGL
MDSSLCLVLLFLALFSGSAFCQPCQILPGNGTLDEKKVNSSVSCFRFNNDKPKLMVLRNILLKDKDTLLIQDVDAKNSTFNYTLLTSQSTVPFEVVLGLSNTAIYFNSTNVTISNSTWSIQYSDDLTVDITNDLSTRINAPKFYAPGTKLVSVLYKVTSYLPSTSIPVVTFVNNQWKSENGYILIASGASNHHNYSNPTELPDFFADEGNSQISINVTLNTTEAIRDFILSIDPVIKACSGVLTLSSTLNASSLFDNLPEFSSPYTCHRLINSSNAITIKVDSFNSSSGQQLTITDGSSSLKKVSKYFYEDVNDFLYISPVNEVLVTLKVGESSRNVSVKAFFDLGTQLNGKGNIVVSKDLTQSESFWQLIAEPYKVVKVNFQKISNATVTVYSGLQRTEKVFTVLNSSDMNANPVIGGNEMLLHIKTGNRTENTMAEFESIPDGCDHESTDLIGQWSYSAKTSDTSCSCSIVPYLPSSGSAQQIVLYLDTITLSGQDTLKIVSPVVLEPKEVAKFNTSVSLLQVVAPINEGFRVEFTRTGNSTGSQVSIHYKTVETICGGDLNTGNNISVYSSPNYPYPYPLNALCTWRGNAKDKSSLITVNDLNLLPGHNLTVKSGSTSMKYEGTKLPQSSLLVKKGEEVDIQFSSQSSSSSSATGVSFTYKTFDEGETIIGVGGAIPVKPNVSSVYMIQVNSSNPKDAIVNVTVTANPTLESDLKASLIIYDGATPREPVLKYNLSEPVLSKNNTIIITYKPLKPNITFTLSYIKFNCSAWCQNGYCMHPDWLCNGVNNCGDNTDELYCNENSTTPSPQPTTTARPEAQDYSGWVKSGWVPGCLAIGILLGMILYFAVPRIINKFRGRGGNYSRMGDDRVV